MAAKRRGGSTSILMVLLALVLGACGTSGGVDEVAGASSTTTSAGAAPASVAPPGAPPCRSAPIEERAATVLVVGIGDATTADDPLVAEVSALGVGGVFLLGPNVVGAAQVQALIDGLRERSPRDLLISVDEEGGRVSRLRPIIGPTPPARALGQQPLSEITAVAAERGVTLRDLGFDLVLAPVVDADGGAGGASIGDRSFAATPAEAGRRAAAFADGLRQAEVGAVAKHFPGQGELADSHDGPVVSDVPLSDLERDASAGFGPVLEAEVEAVMMSHVTFPSLGPLPASVEPAAYDLLRSVGFNGVAVTDALNMAAIAEQWPLPEATVMALAAGADLVLATPGNQATAARDAVVAAVAGGRLPEARLDDAVRRVLTLRGEDPASMVCG